MPTVFLSYRKSDTGGEAGRLSDSLKHRLGRSFVFRDVADIPPGAPFDAVLDGRLATAKVVLVLIGPAWLGALKQRLKQTDIDYVHVEVATALSKEKRVIPVLLKGAMLPPVERLPEDLAKLVKCQAMTIRDESWNEDVDRLVEAIGRPYRWDLLARRARIALSVILGAAYVLVYALDLSVEYYWPTVGFFVIIYALLFELYYEYFRKLKRDHSG
jgi:hypothetical protein